MRKSLIAAAIAAILPVAPVRAQSSATTWDGVYSREQAGRGGALYMALCAQCHGPQLGGIDAAPALTGGAFASNWSGVSLADMLDRIRVSMPQNDPGSLSRQQTADILSFLLEANGFPAGERELPRQRGFLQAIIYEARQP